MLGSLLAVAALLGLAAPLVQALLWQVPFGMLSVGMVLRSVVGTAIVTMLLGLLTAGCFAVIPVVAGEQRPFAVNAVAAGCGLALVLASSLRMRRLRGALLLAYRVREPGAREPAWRALRAHFDAVRPKDEQGDWSEFASLVLVVIGPLTQAGLWDEAEELLGEPPTGSLGERQRALRAQALATCRLQRGDTEGARDALTPVARPVADPGVEAWLRTTEGLLLAVEERPEEALELVGERAVQDDVSLRASRRIVRAHAFAARGEPERARQELHDMRDEAGGAGLDRATQPEGPASDIARDVRAEKVSAAEK